VLNGHIESVNSVAFSSNGGCIVSGSWDNSVLVWDALTGEGQLLLNGHTDWVNSVAFSSDGSHIVSGSWDNSVWVWDALMGEEMLLLNGHTQSVNSVAFSSNGSHIVSGSWDNSVRVWDALTGDGSLIDSGSDNSAQVWGTSMQDQVSRYTWEKIAKPTHALEFTGWLLSTCGEYIMFVPPGESRAHHGLPTGFLYL